MPNYNMLDILIVDDDDGHRALIEKNLRRADVFNEIVSVNSGQEALDFVFFRHKYAERKQNGLLILLDLNMPGVDGIDVLTQIKVDTEAKKIPVIILTTADNQEEIDICYKLGCSAYIIKPIDHVKFIGALNKLGLFISILSAPIKI